MKSFVFMPWITIIYGTLSDSAVRGGGRDRQLHKGGARVAVSQPALSAAVAKLETEMGAKLFERRRDRVVPTPAGSRFLEAARGILLACNSIKSDLRGITAPRMLRVGFLQTLSTARIADLVGAFRRARPDVAIGLFDDSLDGLQRRLDQKRVDVAR